MMRIKKKYFVVILSYLITAAVVLGGFVIQGKMEIHDNQQKMSAPYRANFASLADSLNTIDITLQKGAYATTPYQAMILAANVWLEAGSAKVALEQLPVYDLTMTNTSRYLNQVGEYAFYLAKKAVSGEEITEEEQKNLQQLGKTAGQLSAEMQELQQTIMNDGAGYKDLTEMLKRKVEESEDAVETLAAGGESNSGGGQEEETGNPLEKLELSFSKDAKLVYDGLFSDHMKDRHSEYIDGFSEISEEDAKNKAAAAIGIPAENLYKTGEVDGNGLYCYAFADTENQWAVSVTKKGGLLQTLSRNREIGDLTVSDDDAIKNASEFLSRSGFTDFLPVFRTIDGNILNLVFAPQRDGVIIYTEKISVGVALDNGEIVFIETSEYLMNKKLVRSFNRGISQQEAAKTLSDRLTEQECRQAVIFSDGNYENFCYEFKTVSDDGKTILVYINAENGREEKIAIFNDDDRGQYLS